MAEKVPETRAQVCSIKHRFSTRGEAWKALEQWRKRRKSATSVRVYRCNDHWHLGRPRTRRRRKDMAA